MSKIARLLGQETPQELAQRGYEREKFGVAADDLNDAGVSTTRKALYTGKHGPPGSPGYKFVSNWLRANQPTYPWYQRPMGLILVGVAVGLLVLIIWAALAA